MTEPTEDSTAPSDSTGSSGSPAIRFIEQPTVGDLVWHNAELIRGSALITVLGTFITVSAAIAFVLGDLSSVLGVLLGLSFLTGVFVVPFVWWSVRQRRDLLLASVSFEIDDQGLSMTTTSAKSRLAWSVYRRARETSRAFVLDTGAGSGIILLKRAMGVDVTDAVRDLLRRVGLLKAPPSLARRLRPLLWVAVGLLAVAVLIGGTALFATSGANAAIDVTPTVAGRQVTLEGTTDLPDGTILDVQVFQFDAWQRALASGGDAALDFEWIETSQATVQGGRFRAAADLTGWPPGRGMAAIYFWIDDSQPDAVTSRFGRDGAGLHGPHVVDDEDTGPTLRVDHGFDIPE